MKIYKYEIEVRAEFSLNLPVGAKILTVQVQHDIPVLWALVDPSNTKKETRIFILCSTGGEIYHDIDLLDYIGSFQLDKGYSIGHLFELTQG